METNKITNHDKTEQSRIDEFKIDCDVVSIGIVESIFNRKNGTPRQSGICPQSKGIIRINKKLFNNPSHPLIGIEKFSYLWIIFYFHENKNKRRFIAKIHPPRLNGSSCGVFASRSPHRPNPFGLTIVKLDRVEDGCLYISGLDMINDTPVIDIKPFIVKYDYPYDSMISNQINPNIEPDEKTDDVQIFSEQNQMIPEEKTKNLDWIDGEIVHEVQVDFTVRSLQQLSSFHSQSFHMDNSSKCNHCFRLLNNEHDAKEAIINLLKADPRSVYRRKKCVDRLYYFTIDSIHITAWFDIETDIVEVIKIKPWNPEKK
ncbi:tRNA (adenine(37)-N6)-methyltransferase-like [Dermatophagoides pteronyssinus]|uniref:tRNA (adenine(37)-N6)-methyltransferase-like n=1 Tax=Dermatophagoides pteronyssinus TaxID=6956 RepID=UPI003F67C6AF